MKRHRERLQHCCLAEADVFRQLQQVPVRHGHVFRKAAVPARAEVIIVFAHLIFFLPALRAGAAWDQRENADPFSNSLFRHTLAVCGNHA